MWTPEDPHVARHVPALVKRHRRLVLEFPVRPPQARYWRRSIVIASGVQAYPRDRLINHGQPDQSSGTDRIEHNPSSSTTRNPPLRAIGTSPGDTTSLF